MLEQWLRPVLGLFLTVILYWGITFDHRKRSQHKNQLYAPIGLIIFLGGACSLFCVVIGYGMMQEEFYDNETWPWAIVLFISSLLSLVYTVDIDFRKAVWNDDEIIMSRLFRPEVTLSWNQVRELERSDVLQSWRLRFKDRAGFGFHDYMKGSEELVIACAKRPNIIIPAEYEHLRGSSSTDIEP